MTDKELKHLSRAELLQMLIEQMEEKNKLEEELQKAQAELQSRQIAVEKAGTLAEAALQLNGVFAAAEAAASQYLENIQRMSEEQELINKRIEADARIRASAILEEAENYSRNAHAEADSYWNQIYNKVQDLLKEQESLRVLLQAGKGMS